MELQEAIQFVNKKFVFVENKHNKVPSSNWFVMKEFRDHFYGDSESYSLTIMYLVAGGYFNMFWKLLTGEFQLHFVSESGINNNHMVGYINDVWFDNYTLSGNTKEKHFEKTRQIYGERMDSVNIVSDIIYSKLFGL